MNAKTERQSSPSKKSWIYLFIASLMEICWTFSLKALDVDKLKSASWVSLYGQYGFITFVPIISYFVFSIGNVYFLSVAMQGIPPSTAYAVWMAAALAGIKATGVLFLHERITFWQTFFFICVVSGVIGLKSELK